MFSFHRRPPGQLWPGQSHHYQLLPVKLQVLHCKRAAALWWDSSYRRHHSLYYWRMVLRLDLCILWLYWYLQRCRIYRIWPVSQLVIWFMCKRKRAGRYVSRKCVLSFLVTVCAHFLACRRLQCQCIYFWYTSVLWVSCCCKWKQFKVVPCMMCDEHKTT